MSRNNDFAGQYSRIENTTSLKGEIISSGDFRVDGILEGSIKIKGKIVVGKEGLIDGSVSCESADIEGKLKGKINVSGSFNLRSTAIVASIAPKDKEPTSPINTCAGYELYQRNPSPDPTIALENIAISETPDK